MLFLSNLFLDVCDCYVSCYNLSLSVYTNEPVLVLLEYRNTRNNPNMSLNRELDQLVSEFSMEILIFYLGCRLRLPMYGKDKNKNRSAVGLINLMDPVVSDQSDLEFWLHLIWRMGIRGVLIFRLGYWLPQRPCANLCYPYIC